MAHIGTLLTTWLFGECVGEDAFGNRYFRKKGGKAAGFAIGRPRTERRWVVYQGAAEPSKVPPGWHAWLHQITDSTPPKSSKQHTWQKPHIPNLTGTDLAYRPPGHVSQGGKRDKATGDYEAWTP